jgi:hypothetical protein
MKVIHVHKPNIKTILVIQYFYNAHRLRGNFNTHDNISKSCTTERVVQYPITALSCGPNSSLLEMQYITWFMNLRTQQTDVMRKENAHKDFNFSLFLPELGVKDAEKKCYTSADNNICMSFVLCFRSWQPCSISCY